MTPQELYPKILWIAHCFLWHSL